MDVAALPQVDLEIVRGRANHRLRRVDVPVFLIGSDEECDLVLADPAIPEIHTYLYVNEGGVTVRRLGEGPTLAVDGREVQTSPVVDGQTLEIGGYMFAVHISAPIDQHDEPGEHDEEPVIVPLSDHQRAGIGLVRALLDDIRTSLRVESRLKLYVEQELPWRTVTGNDTLLVRKASA